MQKALKALENSTFESLTPYQSKALYSVLNGEGTLVSFVIFFCIEKRGCARQATSLCQVRFTSLTL